MLHIAVYCNQHFESGALGGSQEPAIRQASEAGVSARLAVVSGNFMANASSIHSSDRTRT